MTSLSNLYNISESVAFSGHRSFKLLVSRHTFADIRHSLRQTLIELCEQGYKTFYSGMAEGFDLIAAEEIITLKRDYSDISLVAVIPYPAQSRGFDSQIMQRYADVLDGCDQRVILSGQYSADCFHKRNNYLIDNSSALVCYYNGSSGGTQYTVNKAAKSGHKIINLYPEPLPEATQLPLF